MKKDKYTIQKLIEEQLAFNDFGFKILIIQELMYNKELLKPKFDIDEFVECYDKRKIDLEEEGYNPIPEVTQYFKDLPIPKSLAPEITEIDSDAGDDIFLQLLVHGSGDEDLWDIKTGEDAKQFPNLKKITFSYIEEDVLNEFIELGIEADEF